MNRWELYALEILKRLNKKEKAAYRKITKEYEELTKELMNDLSKLYEKVEKEGKLTYAEANRFNDLRRFQSRIMAQTTLLGLKNREIINNLLEESYDLSYSFMSYAIEKEMGVLLAGSVPNAAALVAASQNNPIYGLRLTEAQRRDRALTIKGINDAIEKGIKQGDTYGTVAKNIRAVFDSSSKRSMTIARTETHRVRGQAEQDSSMNAHKQGVEMEKIWRNMDDEKVRETKKANHVNMNGQRVPVDQPFIMKDNPENSGMSPGNIDGPNSGSQNIRCRCYASRRVMRITKQIPKQAVKDTYEAWKASKQEVGE